MYGGQGKNNKGITEFSESPPQADPHVVNTSIEEWAGLHPPQLGSTGEVVRGDTKRQMRKENKIRRRLQKLEQPALQHWTVHTGTMTPTDPAAREWPQYRNSMCPSGRATAHPAASMLAEWATLGCPTKMGQPWTKEEM